MERATTKAPTSETPSTMRMTAPLTIASRWDAWRSSRALASMSLRRVASIVSMALILMVLWSYQSRYDRTCLPSIPFVVSRMRLAYMFPALISGLPLSRGAMSSSALSPVVA